MRPKEKHVRLIARLDVKGENLIKGVHLDGLRVIGAPQEHARRYYEQGADELIKLSSSAPAKASSDTVSIFDTNMFIGRDK